jgi:hypothetical protein
MAASAAIMDAEIMAVGTLATRSRGNGERPRIAVKPGILPGEPEAKKSPSTMTLADVLSFVLVGADIALRSCRSDIVGPCLGGDDHCCWAKFAVGCSK